MVGRRATSFRERPCLPVRPHYQPRRWHLGNPHTPQGNAARARVRHPVHGNRRV